ncbi:MAG: endonuclease/exonuclease/phosphatase family protein [Planctomycetota bacterium]
MNACDPTTGVPTTLRGSAALLLWLIGTAATAGSVLGLLGDRPWFLDLFSHFRLQYAAGLVIAVIGMLCFRKWGTAGVFGGALVLNAVLIAPLWLGPERPDLRNTADIDRPGLRLVAFNVLTSNRQKSAVIGWLNEGDADVMVLQEVNAAWVRQLDDRLDGYRRLPTDSIREDNFGMAVYLREGAEVSDIRTVTDPAGVPRLEMLLDLDGRPVRLLGVHTLPPVGGNYSWLRGEQLAEVGRIVNASAEPVVVAGDLNATRWSAPMRRLLRDTDLRDSAEGFGLGGTWPSGAGWTGRITIDHVLVDPAIEVRDRWLGPALGSDHLAVVVDLSWR